MSVLGDNVRRRREELDISQDELANRVGLKSRASIARLESGHQDIPLSKLSLLARALDTSVTYLLGLPCYLPSVETHPVPLDGFSGVKVLTTPATSDAAVIIGDDSAAALGVQAGDIVFTQAQSEYKDGDLVVVLLDTVPVVRRVRESGKHRFLTMEGQADHSFVPPIGRAVTVEKPLR